MANIIILCYLLWLGLVLRSVSVVHLVAMKQKELCCYVLRVILICKIRTKRLDTFMPLLPKLFSVLVLDDVQVVQLQFLVARTHEIAA